MRQKTNFVKYTNYLSGLLCNNNLRYGLATGGMGMPGVRPARNPGLLVDFIITGLVILIWLVS